MPMRGQGLRLVLIGLAGAVLPGWAQLSPVVFPGGGTSSSDRWTNLTATNFSGYGSFPGKSAWPSPISSNQAGGGDAKLERLAGAPGNTGGPYPAGEGIYFGNMTQNANDPGGTLQVVDTTPVPGVRTIVFQIRIMEAMGHDFVSPSGIPQLYLNNELVGTSALPMQHTRHPIPFRFQDCPSRAERHRPAGGGCGRTAAHPVPAGGETGVGMRSV
jgi:hypothetical protein